MDEKAMNELVKTQLLDIVNTIKQVCPNITYLSLGWCDDEESKYITGFAQDNNDLKWRLFE